MPAFIEILQLLAKVILVFPLKNLISLFETLIQFIVLICAKLSVIYIRSIFFNRKNSTHCLLSWRNNFENSTFE